MRHPHPSNWDTSHGYGVLIMEHILNPVMDWRYIQGVPAFVQQWLG